MNRKTAEREREMEEKAGKERAGAKKEARRKWEREIHFVFRLNTDFITGLKHNFKSEIKY